MTGNGGQIRVRILSEKGLGAIRLDQKPGSFYVLTLPEGAPEGSGDMFLKGMEDGRNAPPFFLEDPLPEGLGRSEIKAYGKTVLEKCLDKMVPELGKNLGIPHVRYSLDCPGKAFGLCSRDGLIRLNPCLVWMRRDVLREAVLHEMNHLLMQSEAHLFTEHPPAFWENLTRLEPMWPYLEGWMRGRRRAGRKHGICV